MKRKDFLIRFGVVAALLMFLSLTQACQKKDQAGAVDFTIDLTDPQYSQLGTIGGYVVVNNVIIAKDQANQYIACSSLCTFDATTLQFNGSYNLFVCPSCSSQFDTNGAAGIGRATQPLVKYNVLQSGNSLRVYS